MFRCLCIKCIRRHNISVAASVTIKFSYTEKYPDEVPIMEITESENLEDEQLNELIDMLHTQVK